MQLTPVVVKGLTRWVQNFSKSTLMTPYGDGHVRKTFVICSIGAIGERCFFDTLYCCSLQTCKVSNTFFLFEVQTNKKKLSASQSSNEQQTRQKKTKKNEMSHGRKKQRETKCERMTSKHTAVWRRKSTHKKTKMDTGTIFSISSNIHTCMVHSMWVQQEAHPSQEGREFDAWE